MSVPESKDLRTDVGNSRRFAARFEKELLYVPHLNKWFFWDGRRWQPDNENRIVEFAKISTREYLDYALSIEDPDERKGPLAHALRSENRTRLLATIDLAKSDKRLVVAVSDLDSSPWLFNCENGTIDLRSGKLRPHRREDMITKLAPVQFDPDAKHPAWVKLLHSSTQGDAEQIRYLQKIAGYCLTGVTTEEKLLFFYGPPASGKTTYLEALKSVMGDYAKTADFETFLKRSQPAGIRNDLARLPGVRLVTGSEVPAGREFDEATVKQLTGGDTITARMLYAEYFEFKPLFKILLAGNHLPGVRDNDPATWRRLRVIPFSNEIPEQDRDPNLKKCLTDPSDAGPAILAWMVKGVVAWQEEGLQEPEVVRQATQEYRAETEVFSQFIDHYMVEKPGEWISNSDFSDALNSWNRTGGNSLPYSPKQISMALRGRGHAPKKCHGVRGWQGISLRSITDLDTSDVLDSDLDKSQINRSIEKVTQIGVQSGSTVQSRRIKGGR